MERNLAREKAHGEMAVDGLLAGGAAGVAMALYLVLAGATVPGLGPVEVLRRFDPGGGGSALTGALAHLAVAGVYGTLFGLGLSLIPARWRNQPRVIVLAAVAYGLALWGIAITLILPTAAAPLRDLPALHFAVAHVVYGVALGWLIRRVSV